MPQEQQLTFLDIETSPNIVTSWNLWPKFLSPDNIIQERVILCAAWSHQGEDEVHFTDDLFFNKDGSLDDRNIVMDILDGLKDTHIVVGHNAEKFDLKWIRGRALANGLPPLPPMKCIDTLKIARKLFYLNSYRLNYLGQYLEVGEKIHTDYELWMRVMRGDKDAMAEMVEYNIEDVELLERVYDLMRPHMTNIVTHNTIATDDSPCPHCNSTDIHKRGWGLNLKTKYQRYQCQNCNTWLRGPNQKITIT